MNLYEVLNVNKNANIWEICLAYQQLCSYDTKNIIIYTKAFKVLINRNKRILYDAILYKISVEKLYNLPYYDEVFEIDEYLLISFIEWLSDFKDFYYDTKYFINNKKYHFLIEEWYDIIENILKDLKAMITSFYLA